MADPNRAKFFMKTLLNTCRVWREDGPAIKRLLDTIDAMRGKKP
jgi:hypothetical protein